MTDKKPLNDRELDALFATAADNAPAPSDDLMARIMADAQAELPQVALVRSPAPRKASWFGAKIAAIGGWPTAAGLASAAVAGLMIGLVTPDSLQGLAEDYLVAASVFEFDDFMPSYGDLLGEG